VPIQAIGDELRVSGNVALAVGPVRVAVQDAPTFCVFISRVDGQAIGQAINGKVYWCGVKLVA
jgi:hypothetical protein